MVFISKVNHVYTFTFVRNTIKSVCNLHHPSPPLSISKFTLRSQPCSDPDPILISADKISSELSCQPTC